MKKIIYLMFILAGFVFLNSCSDDDNVPGNPVMDIKTTFASALFGDSLPFSVGVSDTDVPLSTLKAQLFYGEEMVSEAVIRTKTNSEYAGKIYVPYYANIPNGTATLKLILQNIHFTITEKEYDLALTRPDFPYLTLVAADKEYRMSRKSLYNYEFTEVLPMKVAGYIKAPVMGENGNEITFGWEDKVVTEGSVTNIPFSNFPGEYTISFNTFSYEASPFIIAYAIDGVAMQRVDDNNYKLDLNLTKGQELEIGGIENFSDWWIDPDFFTKNADGKLVFVPMDGSYRITANFEKEYLTVEVLKDGNLASLQADGSGAIWIIGNGVGKPSVSGNEVGWDTNKALCLIPIGNKKYQISFVAGSTIKEDDINFKFFHQKGWGGEFKNDAISTTSDLIFVGDGKNGRDAGNLGLAKDVTLVKGAIYVFTVDLSEGNNKAVLTVVKK
ncbi:DUF5125 domain-containing protein [Dysgonomonas sp. Marseille-P4677]|uniref:DUF5125 domain-containing protein n=1 Tax=Dysgonomonas sp. Marseille-P4677 TaxID=2364790 RepID=UPI0019121AD9|nr:DUF5125 domain-containing protein [Dysgonomonas sp. Marseille-P4677]MBK5722068.1 DUF5125 domain-containing protein [Dysgonomonas sp. Marseille-P4677]